MRNLLHHYANRKPRTERSGDQRRRSVRPQFETLEDRLTPATSLPAGFEEAIVARNISGATAMELAPDGRIWVLEQGGNVKVFHAGSDVGFTARDFPNSSINSSGERGLLGIAFDPNYDINNAAPDYVYLYYTSTTSPNPHNRVSRFTVNNTNPNQPTLGSELVILNLNGLSGATNHNGGAIHFGIDGKLYVAVGDNANGANAQSLSNRLGKILRINPDGSIPGDNPTSFDGISGTTSGLNRAIWAVGLRNPFTFSFRPGTSEMFINDVGQNTWEEINVGEAGANYGWPGTEGDFNQTANPGFTRPFYSYRHGGGDFEGFAITGGAFYNPTAPVFGQFPETFTDDYFFSDFGNDWIHVIDTDTGVVSQFAEGVGGTVDLRVAPDGSLYYLSRNQGRVYRVAYTAEQAPNITDHPADQTESEATSATFTVSATGTPVLHYQWQRAENAGAFTDIGGATAASFTLNNLQDSDNGDRFRVVVTNDFGTETSDPATLTVVNNDAPVSVIAVNSGLTNDLFIAGQQISFSGSATDTEDTSFAASQFLWRVDYITSIDGGSPVERPFVQPFSNTKASNFTPATTGPYTLTDVLYRIVLTVTDSGGRQSTVTRDIAPNIVNLTVDTDPAGLQVTVDAQPFTAPQTFESIVGFQRPLGAAAVQSQGETLYSFASWSDGGARTHTISTPAVDTTYTATYEVAQGFVQDSGTNGIVSIEAENFDAYIRQGGKRWRNTTATAGFSGVRALQAVPITGARIDTNITTTSPRLDYQVTFTKTGTHYVWIRGYAPSGNSDSIHFGLDGAVVSTSDKITGFGRSFGWSKNTMDGAVARINVTTAGLHTINLWMREDGFIVDKLLLTTSSTFTPTGMGPAESPRGGGTSSSAVAAAFAAPQYSDPTGLEWFDGSQQKSKNGKK